MPANSQTQSVSQHIAAASQLRQVRVAFRSLLTMSPAARIVAAAVNTGHIAAMLLASNRCSATMHVSATINVPLSRSLSKLN